MREKILGTRDARSGTPGGMGAETPPDFSLGELEVAMDLRPPAPPRWLHGRRIPGPGRQHRLQPDGEVREGRGGGVPACDVLVPEEVWVQPDPPTALGPGKEETIPRRDPIGDGEGRGFAKCSRLV